MSTSISSVGNFMQSEDPQTPPSMDEEGMAIVELSDETLESVAGGRVVKPTGSQGYSAPEVEE